MARVAAADAAPRGGREATNAAAATKPPSCWDWALTTELVRIARKDADRARASSFISSFKPDPLPLKDAEAEPESEAAAAAGGGGDKAKKADKVKAADKGGKGSGGKDAEDEPPSPARSLGKGDMVEVLRNGSWQPKACIEALHAPTGVDLDGAAPAFAAAAESEAGAASPRCVIVESGQTLALAREKDRDASRFVALASSAEAAAAAATGKAPAANASRPILRPADLVGVWMVEDNTDARDGGSSTSSGATGGAGVTVCVVPAPLGDASGGAAGGGDGNDSDANAASGGAPSEAFLAFGGDGHSGVAKLGESDPANALVSVVTLEHASDGDTGWRLDAAASDGARVTWVRAKDVDGAAGGGKAPESLIWNRRPDGVVRVGELVSYDEKRLAVPHWLYRLSPQVRVLAGLEVDIVKAAVYPPPPAPSGGGGGRNGGGEAKKLAAGEIVRYDETVTVEYENKDKDASAERFSIRFYKVVVAMSRHGCCT